LDFSDEEVLELLKPKKKSRVKRYEDRLERLKVEEEPSYMNRVRRSKKKDFDLDELDDEIERLRDELW